MHLYDVFLPNGLGRHSFVCHDNPSQTYEPPTFCIAGSRLTSALYPVEFFLSLLLITSAKRLHDATVKIRNLSFTLRPLCY